MDGLEAAPKIAALGTGTPIVAITANIMIHDRKLYKQNGMSDYLGKPYTTRELWQCLLKYLTPVRYIPVTANQEDDALQKKLIADFVKDHTNAAADIQKALDEGDIKLAHRLAHTLKGSAKLIGRDELREIAYSMEHALKNGKPEIAEGQMPALRAALIKTLNEIKTSFADNPTPPQPSSKTYDSEHARLMLEKLAPLLKTGNLECLNMISDLRALRTIAGSDELVKQMEDFDFEPALQTLEKMQRELRHGSLVLSEPYPSAHASGHRRTADSEGLEAEP